MRPERNKKRNWLYRLKKKWNDFTGAVLGYIAEQEMRISREELDKSLSGRRD